MRRGARVSVAVIIVALAAVAALVHAIEVPVELVRLTSPVVPYTDATIVVKALPGAACTIVVLYKSGPSRARGLVAQDVNSRGVVSWTWRVGSNTTPGRWPVIVRCSARDDVGELRTLLEVR